MVWIRDTSSVPPEGWQFHVEQTGYTVLAPNWATLYDNVVTHCTANNVPVPSEQEVVDWVCANLTVPCVDTATRAPLANRFVNRLPAPVTRCCGSTAK